MEKFIVALWSAVMALMALVAPGALHAKGVSAGNLALLDSLDAVLARSDGYVAAKEATLNDLKHRLALASDDEKRFWLAHELTEEYSYYDSDSTLVYADLALKIARQLKRPDWIYSVQIKRSYVLAATGR